MGLETREHAGSIAPWYTSVEAAAPTAAVWTIVRRRLSRPPPVTKIHERCFAAINAITVGLLL